MSNFLNISFFLLKIRQIDPRKDGPLLTHSMLTYSPTAKKNCGFKNVKRLKPKNAICSKNSHLRLTSLYFGLILVASYPL